MDQNGTRREIENISYATLEISAPPLIPAAVTVTSSAQVPLCFMQLQLMHQALPAYNCLTPQPGSLHPHTRSMEQLTTYKMNILPTGHRSLWEMLSA